MIPVTVASRAVLGMYSRQKHTGFQGNAGTYFVLECSLSQYGFQRYGIIDQLAYLTVLVLALPLQDYLPIFREAVVESELWRGPCASRIVMPVA
jgi:hypothetical protein